MALEGDTNLFCVLFTALCFFKLVEIRILDLFCLCTGIVNILAIYFSTILTRFSGRTKRTIFDTINRHLRHLRAFRRGCKTLVLVQTLTESLTIVVLTF